MRNGKQDTRATENGAADRVLDAERGGLDGEDHALSVENAAGDAAESSERGGSGGTPNAERGFFAQVWAVVARIPRGRATSYGAIACAMGDPRRARQVGWAMRRCPDGLPWQRVVKADGTVAGGGYAGLRRALLESEGVPFLPDGRVDLTRCGWTPPPEEPV